MELTNSPLELNDVYISDFLSGSEDLPIDILLATYVGPWAVFTSKKSKNNYRKLLKKIVKDGTVFITVDPSDAKNSVISHARRTEEYGDRVTLTNFYQSLNLDDEKMTWKQDSNQSCCEGQKMDKKSVKNHQRRLELETY